VPFVNHAIIHPPVDRDKPPDQVEEIRRYCLFGAMANGTADKLKGFAEQCMGEYDLDGWTVPDLINPGDLSFHGKKT
jgi:hypothetical protein